MQGIFRKENTDKALKYGIYRHLPTYEKIIRNLVSFSFKKVVVVPTSIIHKQVNPMDKDDISYYVWKIDGDSVVKQPVILSDYTSGSNTLVLYGIDEGDEICLAS